MQEISFKPERSQYAHTFGGAKPVMTMWPVDYIHRPFTFSKMHLGDCLISSKSSAMLGTRQRLF
jgi:hypothetical protein